MNISPQLRQHGLTISISGIVSILGILGIIWAAAGQYAKLKADVDTTVVQNEKDHVAMKVDTNKQYEELKKEMSAMRETSEKNTMEIIRAIGRLEGNK